MRIFALFCLFLGIQYSSAADHCRGIGPFLERVLQAKSSKELASLNVPKELESRFMEAAMQMVWAERDFKPEILGSNLDGLKLLREMGVPESEISKIASSRVQHHLDRLPKQSMLPTKAIAGEGGGSIREFVEKSIHKDFLKKWEIDQLKEHLLSKVESGYISGGPDLKSAMEIAERYIQDPQKVYSKAIMLRMARSNMVGELIEVAAKTNSDELLIWAAKKSAGDYFLDGRGYPYEVIHALQLVKGVEEKKVANQMLEDVAEEILRKDPEKVSDALAALRSTGDFVDSYENTGFQHFVFKNPTPKASKQIRSTINGILLDPKLPSVQQELEKAIYALGDQKFAKKIADAMGKHPKKNLLEETRLMLYATAGAKTEYQKTLNELLNSFNQPLLRTRFIEVVGFPSAKRIQDRATFDLLLNEYRKKGRGNWSFELFNNQDPWESSKPFVYKYPYGEFDQIAGRAKREFERGGVDPSEAAEILEQGDEYLKQAGRGSDVNYSSMALDQYVKLLTLLNKKGYEKKLKIPPFVPQKRLSP